MINIERAFWVLGIPITKDKKAIKKAYAEKVKEYHPEEQPELWERVRNAYKEALDYAEEEASFQQEELQWTTQESYQYDTSREEEYTEQQDIPREAEQEDYRNVFIDAQREDASQYQEMLRKTLDTLLRLSRINILQHKGDWIQLLGSEQFNQTWEDELVLQALMTTLSQVRLTKDAAGLVMGRLETMRQRFTSSMQPVKVKMTQDIMDIVKTRNQLHLMQPPKISKKKSSYAWVWILVVVFISIGAIGLAGEFLSGSSRMISKIDAQQKMEEYLEEKYPDVTFDTESAYLGEIVQYGLGKKGEQMIGYSLDFSTPKDVSTKMFLWKSVEGEIEIRYFDNLQAKLVEEDMNLKMQEVTGMEDIQVYMSGLGDEGVNGLENGEKAFYHETYEGDMGEFFKNEAGNKLEVYHAFKDTDSLEAPLKNINPNGKCMIYVKDHSVATVEERLKNNSKLHESGIETELFKVAEEFRLKVWAVGLPGEEYDKLDANISETAYTESFDKRLAWGENSSGKVPNVLPSIATVWYQSEDQYRESGIHVPEVLESGEGMYSVKNWESANDSGLEEELQEFKDEMDTALDAAVKNKYGSPYEIEPTNLPSETSKYLKSQGLTPKETVSIKVNLRGAVQDSYLIVRKDKAGLTDKEWGCVFQDLENEYKEEPCEDIEISGVMAKEAETYTWKIYDTSGYMMIGTSGIYNDKAEVFYTFY